MSQLVKGGKFIYGLSEVGATGTIVIPPQAMEEYGYRDGDHIIIMSGSRASGGFGLTKVSILEKTKLAVILEKLPELINFRIPEARTIVSQGRLFCWTVIKKGGHINVPLETLSEFGVKPGDFLAVGRGSHLSIAFIARGIILKEALKHSELQIFEIHT